jgi:hypothetical protein
VARVPEAEEVDLLEKLWDAQRAAARNKPATVKELLAKFPPPNEATAEEFAAWYAVATVLLNLDETISKG